MAVRIAELPDSGLSAIRGGRLRRVLCASPDYLAARGRPRSPAEPARHETIPFTGSTPRDEWRFGGAGREGKPGGDRQDGAQEGGDGRGQVFRPRARLVVNSADAAIAAALAGRGITRVLSYRIQPQLEAGSLEILLEAQEPPVMPVHLLHKEPGQTSARVRAVVDFLAARLRAEPVLAG